MQISYKIPTLANMVVIHKFLSFKISLRLLGLEFITQGNSSNAKPLLSSIT